MSRRFLLIVVLALGTNCNTSLEQLARLSTPEQAYLACGQLGFTPEQNGRLFQAVQGMRDRGASFEDANNLVIDVARNICDNDPACTTLARGCLELMVEAVYYPRGGQAASPPATTERDFKLPLPGGRGWLLTTEAGGGDCASVTPDIHHTGDNYWSLDFDDISIALDGTNVRQEYDVPVYAAAGGKISEAGYNDGSGNYIAVDHGGGFSTRYLHLRDQPIFVIGEAVAVSQRIGTVGSTGDSTGTHLHFGFRFNDSGRADISELSKITLEGMPLAKYRTRCNEGRRTLYYASSNTR